MQCDARIGDTGQALLGLKFAFSCLVLWTCMSTAEPLPRAGTMIACDRPVKDSIRIWVVLLLLLVYRDIAVAMRTLNVALQSKSPWGFSSRLNALHRWHSGIF